MAKQTIKDKPRVRIGQSLKREVDILAAKNQSSQYEMLELLIREGIKSFNKTNTKGTE